MFLNNVQSVIKYKCIIIGALNFPIICIYWLILKVFILFYLNNLWYLFIYWFYCFQISQFIDIFFWFKYFFIYFLLLIFNGSRFWCNDWCFIFKVLIASIKIHQYISIYIDLKYKSFLLFKVFSQNFCLFADRIF